MKRISIIVAALLASVSLAAQSPMLLNGEWQVGNSRNYTSTAIVPGITTDPAQKNDGQLWYKREIVLPKGSWRAATLELKGARFRPEVYVDGVKVSSAEGGMAATFHKLSGRNVKPGATITLEVALASLNDVPPEDASYIPVADQWRSNNSSCLWDDVVLHFNSAVEVKKVILFPDIADKKLRIDYTVQQVAEKATSKGKGVLKISSADGRNLIERPVKYILGRNSVTLDYAGILDEWSPDTPNMYRMDLTLDTRDSYSMPFGIKEFAIDGKKFTLNGKPCSLRGSTIVWHRWVRDEEGSRLGFDTTWVRDNVVMRLKDHGANLLRFHLGVPPQRILDLCDKYGLLVQYEWSFFHGMPASEESCAEQYAAWLDAAVRHPSIAIYHPYNETEGDQLQRVWSALDTLLPDYPQLAVSERDITHLHKYWWSLFENVGVFHESHEEFDKPIVVDEFGGNYLDGYGNPGGYVTIPESLLRFLGRGHTADMRLKLQDYSHGRIAEYWRRVGAAGIAPFPILSSWEDGNHWFLGPLDEGRPKAVWNSLTAAFSPVAVSAEIWDRNFRPGQTVEFPLWYFNETDSARTMTAKVTVEDAHGKIYYTNTYARQADPFSTQTITAAVQIPEREGAYIIKAELVERPANVKYPVVSKWDVRAFAPKMPSQLQGKKIYIPADENELLDFAAASGLNVTHTPYGTSAALMSRKSWERVAQNDLPFKKELQSLIFAGVSVVMLDVGDIALGQGYPDPDIAALGPHEWKARLDNAKEVRYELFSGIDLILTEAPEPESFYFPTPDNDRLWSSLPAGYSGMWNGYKGGLVVPAYDMSIEGLNARAFVEQWVSRGADRSKIESAQPYYGYELYGFYAYTERQNDLAVMNSLKEQVAFLIEDAPALAVVMNVDTPPTVTDIAAEYQKSRSGVAESLEMMANAGKNLTKTPVMAINFGRNKGRLIISQLLTQGRLAAGFGGDGLYGVRYDATAAQSVLNMLAATEN